MARIRVGLVLGPAGVQAAMPSFTEVPGSYQPAIPGKVDAWGILPGVSLGDPALNAVTVQVDVPDEDATGPNGQPMGGAIRARYPGHFLVVNGPFKAGA